MLYIVQSTKLLCVCAWTENSLIERAKELRTNLQSASEDIASLFTKLGMMSVYSLPIYCVQKYFFPYYF